MVILFGQDLPRHMHLDGELFGGRKKFQSTVSIVKTPEHALWNKISYNVSVTYLILVLLNKLRSHTHFSQSDYLIKVVDIHSHT